MGKRKAAGSIEITPSGRFRAYYNHQLARHTPGRVFTTRKAAEAWLNAEQVLIDQGTWTPPAERRSQAAIAATRDGTTLDTYARTWIENRTTSKGSPLAPRTRNEYASYLDGRLADLAALPLAEVDRSTVERWWLTNQDAPQLRHHAYAFLKSVMADAVDRELIGSNPCKVANAARRTTQRPKALQNDLITGLTPLDVAALADATEPAQWRALVLLLAYSGLRPNEALALTRSDLTQAATTDGIPRWTVRVTKALSAAPEGGLKSGPPKTPESIRFVPLPPHVAEVLSEHMTSWAAAGPDGLLFPSTNPVNEWPTIQQVMGTSAKQRTGKGRQAKPRTPTGFNAARLAIGRPGLRVYDLRRWARHTWRRAGIGDADCEQLLGHTLDPVMGAYVTLDRDALWPYLVSVSEAAGWTNPAKSTSSGPGIHPRLLAAMTADQLTATLNGMPDAELAAIVPHLDPATLVRALSLPKDGSIPKGAKQ